MHRTLHSQTTPTGMLATQVPTVAASRSVINAYAQVKTSTAIQGADAHKLVSMLFNGLQDALHEARGALQRQDIALKCTALSRAARIVDEGLKAGLNLKDGGEVAQNLHALYDYMSMTITKANLRSDAALVDEVLMLVQPVQEAWMRIAQQGKAVN